MLVVKKPMPVPVFIILFSVMMLAEVPLAAAEGVCTSTPKSRLSTAPRGKVGPVIKLPYTTLAAELAMRIP